MRSDKISFSVQDGLTDWSSNTTEATWEDQSNDFREQKTSLDSRQQNSAGQFKNAYNPYAAALADVFGL